MKRLLLPAILALAGIVLIFFPKFFSGSGNIDISIKPNSVIMPAAYKVYSNSDVAGGRFNLFKAVIKNTGKSEIKNLKVQFRVPKYIDEWTDVPSTKDLLPGQTAVVTCFPSFPQSVTEKNTTSKERTDIKITYGTSSKPTEKDESFPFDMTSVNDILYSYGNDKDKTFSDYNNNAAMYACMVSSEDPIIKHYAQTIQNKILCGDISGDPDVDKKTRVLWGVYMATAISGMVYSETGGDETTYGDNTTLTQHVRLPREVVSGNTGLCIELSLLHASVYKAAGLHPVIFLTTNHAVPGIRVDDNGQRKYYSIESTGINGAGIGGVMSAQAAFNRGMYEYDSFFTQQRNGNPAFVLLDIDDLYNAGYKDMEMKEDPITAKEVDEIIGKWPDCLITAINEMNKKKTKQVTDNNRNDNRNNKGDNNHDNTSSMLRYSDQYMNFMYPRNWSVINHPEQQLPILATKISSPNGEGVVEIYQVANAQTPAAAMNYIQQSLARLGINVRYSVTGQRNGMVQFSGTSNGGGGNFSWVGYFRTVPEGVEAVVVGSTGAETATLRQIINSIN